LTCGFVLPTIPPRIRPTNFGAPTIQGQGFYKSWFAQLFASCNLYQIFWYTPFEVPIAGFKPVIARDDRSGYGVGMTSTGNSPGRPKLDGAARIAASNGAFLHSLTRVGESCLVSSKTHMTDYNGNRVRTSAFAIQFWFGLDVISWPVKHCETEGCLAKEHMVILKEDELIELVSSVNSPEWPWDRRTVAPMPFTYVLPEGVTFEEEEEKLLAKTSDPLLSSFGHRFAIARLKRLYQTRPVKLESDEATKRLWLMPDPAPEDENELMFRAAEIGLLFD